MILAQNFVKMLEIRQDFFAFMPCFALKLIRFKVRSSFNPYNFRLDKMTKTSQGVSLVRFFREVLTERIGLKPIKSLVERPLFVPLVFACLLIY